MVIAESQRDKLEVTAFSLSDATHRLEYEKLFESCDDAFIQQSTYWAEAIKDLGPDEPIFILCRQGGNAIAGMPLYLYRPS
jgi:hypothetical protein